MKTCASCGKENEENSKFCKNCGIIFKTDNKSQSNQDSNNHKEEPNDNSNNSKQQNNYSEKIENSFINNIKFKSNNKYLDIILNNCNWIAIILGLIISFFISIITSYYDWSLVLGSIITGLLITGDKKYPLLNGSVLGLIYGIFLCILSLTLIDYMYYIGPLDLIWFFITSLFGQILVGIIFVFVGWFIRKQIVAENNKQYNY